MKKKLRTRSLPETCVLEINGTSKFGDYTAFTVNPENNPQNLPIYVAENRRIKPPLSIGDRFIGKLSVRKEVITAKPITRLGNFEQPDEVIYGIIEKKEGKYYLKPSEKNDYMVYLLDNIGKSKEGNFVKASLSGTRRFKQVKIIKDFGVFNLSKSATSLVAERYDIPTEFSPSSIKEADNLPSYSLLGRENLNEIPFVTIDGDDSKDFDDAVYAKKIKDGYLLIVAIADVAFYVKPGTSLDKDAYLRGNSVYLPDTVIPMLPEKLSNDLCSLRPKEKRAAIACFIEIDNEGNIKNFDFKRAIIKSEARLTYSEVHNALQGNKSVNIMPVYTSVIEPIYNAYLALVKARDKRGALNLETDEYKLRIDNNGNIINIEKEQHFISHKIIEEFMVTANICAALQLKKSKLPIMYRIHEKPQEEKLKEIIPLLHNFKLKLPDINALSPIHFNKILELCNQHGYVAGISELILRLQCQAKYAPQNLGHFGLGLKDYVHFTSPIRRYSDLLIHRALIRACSMPDGGELEDDVNEKQFDEIGEHLCVTERRAVNAERDVFARFVSAFLTPSVGADFSVKISGFSGAGIFVKLENMGAEGLIPMSGLPADNYILQSGNMEMYGEKYNLRFRFGEELQAKLLEASPITGGLIFKYIDPEEGIDYFEKGGRFSGGFKKVNALKKAAKTKLKQSKKSLKHNLKENNLKKKHKKKTDTK